MNDFKIDVPLSEILGNLNNEPIEISLNTNELPDGPVAVSVSICDCNDNGIILLNQILKKRQEFSDVEMLLKNREANEHLEILKKNWKTMQYKCLKTFGAMQTCANLDLKNAAKQNFPCKHRLRCSRERALQNWQN